MGPCPVLLAGAKEQALLKITEYFEPLFGQNPKRARVGHGSFLTLDFGSASRQHHRLWYEWQLWIQHVDWRLMWKKHEIAHSESKRQVMQVALNRLAEKALTKVAHRSEARETRFSFSGGVELVCKAYADSARDEDCWALYTPNKHVLLADNAGRLRYIRSDVPDPTTRLLSKQRNEVVEV